MFGLLDDALDVLDGLSEGELRLRAASRLGASAVAGLDTAELLALLLEAEDDD